MRTLSPTPALWPRLCLCAGLSIANATAETENAAANAEPELTNAKPEAAQANGVSGAGGAGFAHRGLPGGKGFKGKGRLKAFEQADADNDRRLSFAEFSGLQRLAGLEEQKRRKLFERLDRDQDGFLHVHEIHPRGPRWMSVAQDEFDRLDADADGALSAAEFAELPKLLEKHKLAVLFKRMDRNNNDKIERDELELPHHHSMRPEIPFARLDANSSGGLDYQEYSAMPWMLKWPEQRRKTFFQQLDEDGNGEISEAEIKSAHLKRQRHGYRHHPRRHGNPFHKPAVPGAKPQPSE